MFVFSCLIKLEFTSDLTLSILRRALTESKAILCNQQVGQQVLRQSSDFGLLFKLKTLPLIFCFQCYILSKRSKEGACFQLFQLLHPQKKTKRRLGIHSQSKCFLFAFYSEISVSMGKKNKVCFLSMVICTLQRIKWQSNQSGYHSAAFSAPKLFLWAAVSGARKAE